MMKYIEIIQHRAKIMAQHDVYSKDDPHGGLNEIDVSVAHTISTIYGRSYGEVEHDLIVYADHYQS